MNVAAGVVALALLLLSVTTAPVAVAAPAEGQLRWAVPVALAPTWEIAAIQGYGARVAEPALGLITGFPWSAPYEELRLKAR